MQHLRDLLKKKDDSLIALSLWHKFHEIKAFLKEASVKFPQDLKDDKVDRDGKVDINAVLKEIESLLQLASPDSATNQSQKTDQTSKEDSYLQEDRQITSARLKLSPLRDAFHPDKDKDVIEYLDDVQLSSQTGSDLWNEVLQGNKYEDLFEDLKLLACLVFIWIYSIDREPDLHHALETVNKFNIINLHSKPEQRKKYIEALKERFQRTIKAEDSKDLLEILKAWIDIDEAIHSLVFVPPADSDSWFCKLKKQSRRILIEKAKKAQDNNYDVRIQELSGVYANIHNLSSNYDLPLKDGGIPGEVQTCLRVYARINQQEFPGRVIYRSSN